MLYIYIYIICNYITFIYIYNYIYIHAYIDRYICVREEYTWYCGSGSKARLEDAYLTGWL